METYDDVPEEPASTDTLRSEEKTWGMACHLAAFSGHIIPFGNILGPLIVWLMKKEESWFVDDQGKESLNFQITLMIAGSVAGIVVVILFFTVVLFPLGIMLVVGIWLGGLVLTIMACIKASQGEVYRYPWNIRFLS